MKSRFSSRLKFGVSAIAVTAMSITAQTAYAADKDKDTEELEEIIVTGSRIKRKDLTSPSPVAVIDASAFKAVGTVNVEEVLNQLPQAVPGLTASSNNPGTGTATVDLRGLGESRTLVLVNGQRYIPGSLEGTVDLNTIPSALIKQVHVVTGGASAVYGSDAMAGVVNFILKDDFEGMEVSGSYGMTTKGDGAKWNVDTTIGGNFADDRGNAYLHASFAKRKSVFQGDREFSTYANWDNGAGKTMVGGSASPPQGRLSRITFYNTNTTGANVGGTTLSATTGYGTGFKDDGTNVDFDKKTDLYNYAPANYLQLPQDRWMVDSGATYKINENVTFYTKGTFTYNRVDTELAATPAWGIKYSIDYKTNPYVTDKNRAFFKKIDDNETETRKDPLDPTKNIQIQKTDKDGNLMVKDGKPVMVDQRFLTAGAGDGKISYTLAKRMLAVGSRQSQNSRKGFRMVAGLRGDIDDNWGYDVSYTKINYSRAAAQNGNIAISKMQQAADVIVVNGVAQCRDTSGGCAPLNLFGKGSVSEAAANFIKIGVSNLTEINTQNVLALMHGSFEGFDAGEIGVSFGAEWRTTTIEQRNDEFLASGDVKGFNAGLSTNGETSAKEIFGEVRIPLLENTPFAERLEFSGALRYSDYTSGGVWSYASGLDWSPINGLTLRGQYQRAVRAPNIDELFGGQSQGFPTAKDPCALADANAFCKQNAAGAVQINQQVQGLYGGNPDLKAETSDTFTVGAIFQPEFAEGLNITVDYFNIKITDAIDTLGGGVSNILDLCYNVVKDLNDKHCQAITREAGTNNILSVKALNANTATYSTAGIDIQLDYTMDFDTGLFDDGSSLSFFWLATYLIKSDSIAYVGAPTVKCKGIFSGACKDPSPDFKFTARATYTSGPLTAALNIRYLPSSIDYDFLGTELKKPNKDISIPHIAAETYIDISFNYDINDNYSMNAGVRNLFNNMPTSLGDNQQQANTYPNVYDLLGTYVFVGAKVKF